MRSRKSKPAPAVAPHDPAPEDMPFDPGGFLRAVVLRRDLVPETERFPWTIPALRNLEQLDLHPRVTFLVGDNGSGKSTLLEAIADAAGFGQYGGTRGFNQSAASSHWSDLGAALSLVRGVRRERDGFFLRAESFYEIASQVDDFGVNGSYGGRSLHAQSHGESFMAAATNRWRRDSLYLLDEPEAALSPTRQIEFLKLIDRLAQDESCQFVIATHSPILLAYPDARIYFLSEDGIADVAYEETEHFQLTRAFLNHRERFLRDLLVEEEPGR